MEYFYITIDGWVRDVTETIPGFFFLAQWFTVQYYLYLTGFRNIVSYFWKGETCANFQLKGEK